MLFPCATFYARMSLGASFSCSFFRIAELDGEVQFADLLLPFIMSLILVTVLEPVKQARARAAAIVGTEEGWRKAEEGNLVEHWDPGMLRRRFRSPFRGMDLHLNLSNPHYWSLSGMVPLVRNCEPSCSGYLHPM